jgi:hypothetical protein
LVSGDPIVLLEADQAVTESDMDQADYVLFYLVLLFVQTCVTASVLRPT